MLISIFYTILITLLVSICFVGIIYIIEYFFTDDVCMYEYPDECNDYFNVMSGKYTIKVLTKESCKKRLEYLKEKTKSLSKNPVNN